MDFSFTYFLFFSTLKNKPSRSRRSASGVKEKCARGQGEVHQGSRRSALGVKEKWVRGVYWRPLGPYLKPGCPLAPLNLLKGIPKLKTNF